MQQETWSEFIYRVDNRMVEYSDSQGEQWEYRYDPFGRRYEKERFGSAHPEKDVWRDDQIWYVGLTHNILAEYTDIEYWNDKTIQTGLEYLVGPGGRAYGAHERYTRDGHEWSPSSWKNRRYYHYDRLGSATAISLDKPGVAGETYNYSPFGQVLDGEHRWGWDYNGNHHMGFDSVGFTGYRIDAESGLYHAPYREYDPLVANWTTSDPIKSGELWYEYCGSNPVLNVDPLGLWIYTGRGTAIAEPGDSLWGLAGNITGSGFDWTGLTGYNGDPRKMPIGTEVDYNGLIPQSSPYTFTILAVHPKLTATSADTSTAYIESGRLKVGHVWFNLDDGIGLPDYYGLGSAPGAQGSPITQSLTADIIETESQGWGGYTPEEVTFAITKHMYENLKQMVASELIKEQNLQLLYTYSNGAFPGIAGEQCAGWVTRIAVEGGVPLATKINVSNWNWDLTAVIQNQSLLSDPIVRSLVNDPAIIQMFGSLNEPNPVDYWLRIQKYSQSQSTCPACGSGNPK
jgi:RHS repeat-associated protein